MSLAQAVSKIFLFGGLDKEQTLEVLDAMFEKKVCIADTCIQFVCIFTYDMRQNSLSSFM